MKNTLRRNFRTRFAGIALALAGLAILALGVSCVNPLEAERGAGTATARAVATEWTAGTYYAQGAVVSYGGSLWTCRQPHTALVGWEPPNVPALWLQGGTADPVAPETPSSLSARSASTTSVTVSWSSVTGADSYDLEADGTVISLTATQYTHSGLATGSTHSYRVRAANSVGKSAWSAALTTTVTEPVVTNLPAHILTGYWQNFNNGAQVLRISEVPAEYNLICVSFADATATPGAVAFNLDPSLGFSKATFIADIAAVKARGQHVIVSVGGQNGTISVADPTSANNFANSVISLMNEYGFEGVDIDLENGVNSTYMAQALRKLPAGSIITMAPETIGMQSSGAEYFKLALNISDILTVCNMQYYNSGTMLGEDGKVYAQGGVDFLTALAAIQLEHGLRPDQVGLGLPASTRGASSGYVDPSIVIQALDTLAYGTRNGNYVPPNTYPDIRGVMTWSINWDATNGWAFSKAIGAKLAAMNGTTTVDTQAPTAPTNFAATAATSTSITVGWSASSDNVGVTAYEVSWTGGAGAGNATVTGTSVTANGLAANTTYSFAVKARDAAGNASAAAALSAATVAASDTQAPTAPTNLAVTATAATSIALGWTAGSDNVGVAAYDVSWTGASGSGSATVTGTSATAGGLTANSTYTFTVKARDAAGNSSAAASLSAKTSSESTTASAWTAGTYYAVGKVVTYAGKTWTCRQPHTALVGWEPPNVPALWLEGGTVTDDTGDTGDTVTVPGVPANVSASAVSTSSVYVSWSPVTGATSYTVEADGVANTVTGASFSHTGLSAATTHSYRVQAVNSAGSSPWSSMAYATTKTETGTGDGSLPKRIMSGYWHTWGGGASGGVPFVKLRDVNPGWDVINVSFAEPVTAGSGNGSMKFAVSGLTSDYTVADFKADIKALQAKGKKIVLAIGGYEGYFSLDSTAAINTFVSNIQGFIDEYGFDGIDIDLEQSSVQLSSGADPDFRNPTSPKVVNMIQAIRRLCDANGSDFILSWAPETFYLQLGHQYYAGLNPYVDARAGCYIPMIYALRDKTTYVQAQLYNSGVILGNDGQSWSMGTADAIVAMCSMLLDGFTVNGRSDLVFPALRADQVLIAVPASSSAAGSGQVSNAALQQAFARLEAAHPGLRGIMSWSINWDAYQNGNSFVQSNAAYLATLP